MSIWSAAWTRPRKCSRLSIGAEHGCSCLWTPARTRPWCLCPTYNTAWRARWGRRVRPDQTTGMPAAARGPQPAACPSTRATTWRCTLCARRVRLLVAAATVRPGMSTTHATKQGGQAEEAPHNAGLRHEAVPPRVQAAMMLARRTWSRCNAHTGQATLPGHWGRFLAPLLPPAR